jgi:hypothetical protein
MLYLLHGEITVQKPIDLCVFLRCLASFSRGRLRSKLGNGTEDILKNCSELMTLPLTTKTAGLESDTTIENGLAAAYDRAPQTFAE